MSGRNNWQAWHTASISRQLMCRPDSSLDHRPKVGLPSHSAPQPLLEASVVTTFLLCTVSRITPCFSQKGSLLQARADTQARVTVTRWRPWRQAADGTLCFSQNWMGRMWSRPNWSTGGAAAIRPSVLWKDSSRRAVHSLKENFSTQFLVLLNCHGSPCWDNCTQERNPLAGWQYALGKADPEPQAIKVAKEEGLVWC